MLEELIDLFDLSIGTAEVDVRQDDSFEWQGDFFYGVENWEEIPSGIRTTFLHWERFALGYGC